MKQWETAHYVFQFEDGSPAERDIRRIAAIQEGCWRHICQALKTEPDFKIHYMLCVTPEQVGRLYGDNEPCNGFAAPPDTVYAVYNDRVQCIGFHEDAHLISYCIHRPDSPAVREGLAMYFDRVWWGIDNLSWAVYMLKTGRYLPVDRLLDRETFFSYSDAVTYPIMGAFTQWLIAVWGMESYLAFYRADDPRAGMERVYGKTPADMDREFTDYLRLFPLDEALARRMAEKTETSA